MEAERARNVFAESLGARIRAEREARQWSLELLAGLADIGKSTLAQIEVGQNIPQTDTLIRIAAGLGLRIEEIVPQDSYETLGASVLELLGRRAYFPKAVAAESAGEGRNARSSSKDSNRSAVTPLKPGKSKASKRKIAAQKDSPTRRYEIPATYVA